MYTITEDLPESIKFYLIASGFNSDLLDGDINNSPPGEDFISRIIKKELSEEEILWMPEYSLNLINSMIRDFNVNDMLPRKMKMEYDRLSEPVLEEYTKENNIEYDFILIVENSDTRPFKIKRERSFITMIDSNTELIQFEEIDIINGSITIDVLENEYLIPAAKRMVREQVLKELLGS